MPAFPGAQSVAVSVGAATTTLVAATVGKRVRVYGYVLVATAAGTLRFEDTDGTDRSGSMAFAANGGASATPGSLPHFSTAAGTGLQIVTSAALEGHLAYVIEP